MKTKTKKRLIIPVFAVSLIAMLISVYYCGVYLSATRADLLLFADLSQLDIRFRKN